MSKPKQLDLFAVAEHKTPKKVAKRPTGAAFFCDICGEANCTADDCIWRTVERNIDDGVEMPARIAERLASIWRGLF